MNTHMVGLNVGLAIHAGKLDAFETIAQAMAEASEKEPGDPRVRFLFEW
jgi:quinol monooxygenase YgiN